MLIWKSAFVLYLNEPSFQDIWDEKIIEGFTDKKQGDEEDHGKIENNGTIRKQSY